MITIVEPREYISTLWSKQRNRECKVFRLMKYVIKIEYLDKVALHNVVTGQLVLLEQNEIELMKELPATYSPLMEQLVESHFLVNDTYDEHKLVVGLRKILRTFSSAKQDINITTYTILPTTACNANCYYCFEQGVETVTMTEQTADDVVDYISKNCGDKKSVFISWFGGEPTVADFRIDQICKRLLERGIDFESDITTNGYLFDEDMVTRAAELWNLKAAMITLDGTEESYNRVKAYSNPKDNPYQRVMRNVDLLAKHKIHVNLRMNFDLNNYMEFEDLVKEVASQFAGNPYIHLRAHPVNGEYTDHEGRLIHGSDEWFLRKNSELNSIAREAGFQRKTTMLPHLRYEGCEANSDSTVTISAKGTLVRCPEQFGDDQTVGNLKDGVVYPDRVSAWKQFADYEKCFDCVLYPKCNRLIHCNAKDRCNFLLDSIQLLEETMKQSIKAFELNNASM